MSDTVHGDKYDLSGTFTGIVNIGSTINLPGQPPAYQPPPPPPRGTLPPYGPLPDGHRMPYGRNAYFTGRETELLTLADLLLYANDDAPSSFIPQSSSFVTISSGLGGVGKTQLAVEFVHRYGQFFHGVHWVSMGEAADPQTEISDCGRLMGLPGFDALTVGDQARRTLAEWAGPAPRLVVFDNCESYETLNAWRPASGGARLLVTSRNTIWPDELGAARRPVNPFARPRSVELLRKYVGRGRSDDDLTRVADKVQDLPLALALAGHYLARYKRESVATYLARLAAAGDLVPIHRSAKSPTDHPLSLRQTFAVSYNRLRPADDPADAAAVALLARAACLAPGEPIGGTLLRLTIEERRTTNDERPTAEGEHAFEDGLERLLELGLIEVMGEGTNDQPPTTTDSLNTDLLNTDLLPSYRLHRLLARFVLAVLGEEEANAKAQRGEGAQEEANAKVAEEAKSAKGEEEELSVLGAARAAVEGTVIALARHQDVKADPRPFRQWAVHFRYVTDVAFDREDERAAELCAWFDFCLSNSGDLAGSLRYSQRALAISERVLGPEHPQTAGSLNNLGALLDSMGDLAGARPYYERALAIRERVLGPEHPDTATSLNNLGGLLWAQGDLAGARPYYERALAILENIVGANHPNVATLHGNLAVLAMQTGDQATAREHLWIAFRTYRRVLPPGHSSTRVARDALGNLLLAMRDWPGLSQLNDEPA